uniref:Uncharacterized protein n=1 Tax=Cannabis sativa TaxID=3483 RepID=A0A803NPI5_CANSA
MYEKSILHTLVTCEVVKACWNRVGIGTNVARNMDFFDWCVHSFETLEVDHQCTLAMAGDGAKRWISPQVNRSKVNVVTTLFDSDHKYGLDLVARDESDCSLKARNAVQWQY